MSKDLTYNFVFILKYAWCCDFGLSVTRFFKLPKKLNPSDSDICGTMSQAKFLFQIFLVTLLLVSSTFCKEGFWRRRRSPTNKMATLDRLKRFAGGDRLKEYEEQVEPAYGYNPVTITLHGCPLLQRDS